MVAMSVVIISCDVIALYYDYCNTSYSFALQHVATNGRSTGHKVQISEYRDISANNISCARNYNIVHLFLKALWADLKAFLGISKHMYGICKIKHFQVV